MAFKIKREEYVNKTFRLDKDLVDKMQMVCDDRNISLNKLVSLCIEYALDNLETDEDDPQTSQNTP